MGMFDYLKYEYTLPETAPEWVTRETIFQTKNTEAQYLENYTITEEGRLVHHSVAYETVPEEERPYFGKPEWESSSFAKFCGCIKSVPTGDVDICFQGDLRFSAMTELPPYEFYNLVARFTNGNVEWIKEEKDAG